MPEGELLVPIGKARLAARGHATSPSSPTPRCCTWRSRRPRPLARDGISVEVLDLRTLLPLDQEAILATARKTGKVLVLHEATRTGGPAARSPR